jgi:hypothetical protein
VNGRQPKAATVLAVKAEGAPGRKIEGTRGCLEQRDAGRGCFSQTTAEKGCRCFAANYLEAWDVTAALVDCGRRLDVSCYSEARRNAAAAFD